MDLIARQIFQFTIVSILLMSISACSKSTPEKAQINPNQTLVQSYVNAYNERDLGKMGQLMHDEVVWINIEGSAQSLVTESKETLVLELTSYFEGDPQSVSALSDWTINGNYISAKETVTFTRKDGSQGRQASLSVYELEDGLIRRVWYFPAQ